MWSVLLRFAMSDAPLASSNFSIFYVSILIIDIAYTDQMENGQIIDHDLFPHMKGIILIIGTPFLIVI
jgi:hypothetical protein